MRGRARAAALAVALGLVLAAGPPVSADEPPTGGGAALADYDPSSKAWNGMATFVKLAAGLGYEVIPVGALEWGDLDERDILVLVYPLQRVDPSNLAAFIQAGGHAVVADDFGDASAALSRLGLLRAEVNTAEAPRYYRSRMYAPIATPIATGHPLTRGVVEVITNHPAVLTEVSGATPIIGFGAGGAVVVAGERGTGRYVVVSDPSILINRMLQFPGNLNLAVNMLRWLDRGGRARRVILLRGDVPMYGAPRPFIDDASLTGVGRDMANINRWLEGRNEWLLTPIAMRVIGALVALALAALALVAMPPWRRRVIDGAWLGPPRRERRDLASRVVAEHDRGAKNFLIPAVVLRDSINVALARAVDHVDPLYQLPERELVARVADRVGRDAAAAVARLGPRLRALPTRVHAAAAWARGRVSERELTDLYDATADLYRHLGEAPLEPAVPDRPTEA
ncbi:MAG: hypothetical protein IPL61_07395 [Myxococcales bacterium]|nr:hypothetical protein [Myxococcales bacterium]